MTDPVSDPQQPEYEVYTPPAFAPPQQPVAPAPVPPKPKRTGVVVLAIFTVLLFGTAGAFGVLFFQEKNHSADLTKQVEGKGREITDLTKQAKDSKDEAAKAAEALKTAEAAQKRAESEAVSSQKCRDAARALRAAAIANDEPKAEQAGLEIFAHC